MNADYLATTNSTLLAINNALPRQCKMGKDLSSIVYVIHNIRGKSDATNGMKTFIFLFFPTKYNTGLLGFAISCGC